MHSTYIKSKKCYFILHYIVYKVGFTVRNIVHSVLYLAVTYQLHCLCSARRRKRVIGRNLFKDTSTTHRGQARQNSLLNEYVVQEI